MMILLCSTVTLVAAILSSWTFDLRRAILALWLCGLGMGGIALDLGAEFLAVVTWIVSTITAIGFVFYSVMFGEFRSESRDESRKMGIKKILGLLTVIIVGVFLYAGNHGAVEYRLGQIQQKEKAVVGPPAPNEVEVKNNSDSQDFLSAVNDDMGGEMIDRHFLTIEVLGFALFLILVASGVIARPKLKEERPNE